MAAHMPKNILVAPLNWGLGHATRCIPIVRALEQCGFVPILASDGDALALLRKEFPHLKALELPSYGIRYSKTAAGFKWAIIRNLPKIAAAVRQEKKIVANWIGEHQISGIISDSRLGVVHKNIPGILITHQLNVPFRELGRIAMAFHYRVMRKFDQCWVPDSDGDVNLSGRLGHLKNQAANIRYIGPLSRLKKMDLPLTYDLAVLLSGPEPQRTMLEEILQRETAGFSGKVLFVRGIVESEQKTATNANVTFYNFMTSEQLERSLNESDLILCRSGYTTVMDLAKLRKKAFFIPTPGQYEQEYLAERFMKKGYAPSAKQDDFTIEKLLEASHYTGLPQFGEEPDWTKLLSLF
jgi:uncharacterized protein (TIGR00661 family)